MLFLHLYIHLSVRWSYFLVGLITDEGSTCLYKVSKFHKWVFGAMPLKKNEKKKKLYKISQKVFVLGL